MCIFLFSPTTISQFLFLCFFFVFFRFFAGVRYRGTGDYFRPLFAYICDLAFSVLAFGYLEKKSQRKNVKRDVF